MSFSLLSSLSCQAPKQNIIYGGQVSLDHVDGLVNDKIPAGASVTFYIRMTNSTENVLGGTANGFRIFSEDGANWATTVGDTTGTLGKATFDGGMFLSHVGVSGAGADTVGFAGFRMQGPGIAAGFDSVTYTITIGPIDAASAGKTICIDSAYYPPSGVWKWAPTGLARETGTKVSTIPAWSGQQCFTISK